MYSFEFTRVIKKVVFENYFNFSGCAKRNEFWYWYLLCLVVNITFSIIISCNMNLAPILGTILIILTLAFIIPSISVRFRRLHDIGKSGFYLFFFFLPIFGWILLFIWYCQKSEHSNEIDEYNE